MKDQLEGVSVRTLLFMQQLGVFSMAVSCHTQHTSEQVYNAKDRPQLQTIITQP